MTNLPAPTRPNRNLLSNFIWFTASLLISVVVWITAEMDNNPIRLLEPEETFTIQVLTNASVIVTGQSANTARVELNAQAETIEEIVPSEVEVVADLSDVTEIGSHNVPLKGRIAGIEDVTIRVDPPQISVELERRQERFVPVNVVIIGDPPASMEVDVADPEINQARISGPAEQVTRVDEVQILLDLSQQRESTEIEQELRPVDLPSEPNGSSGVTVEQVVVNPTTLTLPITVEQRSDVREVRVTPNIVGELPDGYTLTGAPQIEPETIFVTGPSDSLTNLPGTLFTEPIDLSSYTDDFQIEVRVDLPSDDLVLITGQRIEVIVGVQPIPDSRQFESITVEAIGIQEGLEAVIAPETVTVLVTGPQPVVSALERSDVRVIIDLNAFSDAGSFQVVPTATIGNGQVRGGDISVLPTAIDVELIRSGRPSPATETDE
jgi:YbbR domain-containing protein